MKNRRTAGNAMVAVLGLAVIMMSMAYSLSETTSASRVLQEMRTRQLKLRLATESAANVAIAYFQSNWETLTDGAATLEVGGTINVDISSTAVGSSTLNNADLVATITKLSGTNPDNSVYTITATGVFGDKNNPEDFRRYRITMSTAKAPEEVFAQTMLSIEGYDFMGNANTDAWNSTVSDYGGGSTNTSNGDIASEGDITIGGSATVGGDVNDNQEFPLPTFDYSETVGGESATTSLGAVTSSIDLYDTSSPYRASSVILGNGESITVHGNVVLYVDGAVNFKQATINYDDSVSYPNRSSTLRIYQDEYDDSSATDFAINGNTIVGDVTDNGDGTLEVHPERFVFITENDGAITCNGNGALAAAIFAPNASFKFNGTFDMYGSIIAAYFGTGTAGSSTQGKVNGTFDFHYDEGLESLNLDLAPRLLILGWQARGLGFDEL